MKRDKTHKKYYFAPSRSKIEAFNSNKFLGGVAIAAYVVALIEILVFAAKQA